VKRGVIVNEQLQTSVEDVFAAGDAAEFKGQVYGIIPAATEQAQVAAANMVMPGSATYGGTIPAGDEFVILRQVDAASGVYRRLTLRDGKIVGAILLGDTQSVRPVKQLIASRRDVSAYGERLLDEDFDLKILAQGQVK